MKIGSKCFTLISVNDDNLEEYLALFALIFPADDYTTNTVIAEHYERWIVSDAGQALGICGLYGLRGHPGDVWLDWYGLVPERREQGYEQPLLNEMMARARARGGRRFLLWTTWRELEGTRLAAFYKANGFKKTAWMLHYNDSFVFTFDRLLGDAQGHCPVMRLHPDDWLH
ncbi:MAG: GNAT family N-acetyltransferase [Proteobacteria bacterium]|nr:GNAT family N-acetyltransferase [Pseudomonadota bacterium]